MWLSPTSDTFSTPSPAFSPSCQCASPFLSLHGAAQTPRAAAHQFCTIVGRNEDKGNPSVLLQQRCTALERAGKLKLFLQHPVKPLDILNNNFLPYLCSTRPPDYVSCSMLFSLVVPLPKFHSFLPFLTDFIFYCSYQQVHLLFYSSLFYSSLKHKSRSHKSTISASSSYLMTFNSFNHFLFPSNTRLLPNSSHEHIGHSTCHYSLMFFPVIISAVPSSPLSIKFTTFNT